MAACLVVVLTTAINDMCISDPDHAASLEVNKWVVIIDDFLNMSYWSLSLPRRGTTYTYTYIYRESYLHTKNLLYFSTIDTAVKIELLTNKITGLSIKKGLRHLNAAILHRSRTKL